MLVNSDLYYCMYGMATWETLVGCCGRRHFLDKISNSFLTAFAVHQISELISQILVTLKMKIDVHQYRKLRFAPPPSNSRKKEKKKKKKANTGVYEGGVLISVFFFGVRVG